ncbi:DUF2235 domain-containing protein [Ideonella sp. BN130291]|uniref:DUF2235 domain-containing protein n=1 Tax=Ideonella sp. BN130291 TaxID=3112940 RepID=UPI002E261526|nr:DUF2235 domain-containing protein [Ideonella sp. BN130291]
MTNSSDKGVPAAAGPSRQQPAQALASSASASETLHAPVVPAPAAPVAKPSAIEQARCVQEALQGRQPAFTCKVALRLAFFFDGTGNNLDADKPTDEHSNVARLFLAHPDDLQDSGTYAFYIPGLGTYFRLIGDIGDDDGMAFGKYGDQRLDKAMQWLKETIAKHPADKIVDIKLSVFGFSRGAALARAFVRRVEAQCKGTAGRFVWPSVDKPCSVYFLGLFDTVASVGLPASTSGLSLAIAKRWTSLERGLARRRQGETGTGLAQIALGKAPGADPTQAVYDGHMGWAKNLRIPGIVQQTVHLMAMNEARNSFPLDTAWDGTSLPPGATEYAYPGVHSNVGGGYRPGEGGKSLIADLLLSKLPLRHMYDEATAAGVPLLPLTDPRIERDFSYMPALAERFNKVLSSSGWRRGQLGDALLAYREMEFRWRFRKIHLKLRARDKPIIEGQEAAFRRDANGDATAGREGLVAKVARLEKDPQRLAAERDMQRKQSEWMRAVQADPGMDHEVEERAYLAAKARYEDASDEYLRERGRLRTLPSHDGELVGNLDIYDRQLLADVEAVRALQAESTVPLRPHYQRLLDAYLDEFERGQGLTDPLVIDFFDNFVHDSLAGFAKDATLPSDPRCCYIGGDNELKFADLRPAIGLTIG